MCVQTCNDDVPRSRQRRHPKRRSRWIRICHLAVKRRNATWETEGGIPCFEPTDVDIE